MFKSSSHTGDDFGLRSLWFSVIDLCLQFSKLRAANHTNAIRDSFYSMSSMMTMNNTKWIIFSHSSSWPAKKIQKTENFKYSTGVPSTKVEVFLLWRGGVISTSGHLMLDQSYAFSHLTDKNRQVNPQFNKSVSSTQTTELTKIMSALLFEIFWKNCQPTIKKGETLPTENSWILKAIIISCTSVNSEHKSISIP